LYRDTRIAQQALCRDSKKCAMLRSFRLVPGLYPDAVFLLQPPFTQQHKRPLLPGRWAQAPNENTQIIMKCLIFVQNLQV
jgi:hypothetical protein